MMTWPPLITPAAYWWAAEARQEPQPSLAGCPVSDPQTGQRLVCGHRWSPACPLCADSRRVAAGETEAIVAETPKNEMEASPEMSAITDLFAGVAVSDLDASIDWHTRFFGRPPDHRVGDEVLWEIDEHATLFIEPNAAQAGSGRITLGVAGLDALLDRFAAQSIEHEPIETYS